MKPVALCILDGWGLREDPFANAPLLADTPTFDRLLATCPHATLVTHGPDVGLPTGQMGNSEVGHTNIGAGRVVAMDLGQIDLAIETGEFARNEALGAFVAALQASGGTAHLLGVASDGGVHGHLRHMVEAARVIAAAGVPVLVHAVTDGRDVPPASAPGYLAGLEAALPKGARVATVMGRFFAMDRDNRWDRVKAAYDAVVHGQGARARDAQAALLLAAERGETDEFVQPTVLDAPRPAVAAPAAATGEAAAPGGASGSAEVLEATLAAVATPAAEAGPAAETAPAPGGYAGVQPGDGVLCLNFRADRAREILRAFADPAFDGWDRGPAPPFAARLGMVDYSSAHDAWYGAMFPKRAIPNTLGAWVSGRGLRQFRVAETEKYPHVTFFLNGGLEPPFPGEDRLMPPSPKVATYDLAPEMAAEAVTDAFVAAIRAGYDLIVCNYANPDMVGHTGDLGAAIKACEAVDRGLSRVVAALGEAGGAMVLAADHGNCELMVDPATGGPHTAHTLNPVPVVLFGGPPGATLRPGRLADLAPTVLDLMGIEPPPEMTGQSLIER